MLFKKPYSGFFTTLGGYSDLYVKEKKWAKILDFFGLYILTNGYYPFRYRGIFENKLLLGFFESDKYFIHIRDQLKKEFQVKDFGNNPTLVLLASEISSINSICVGVRKGDFISKGNRLYCDICTPDYYLAGINCTLQRMEEKDSAISEHKIYVFSDDVKWVQDNVRFSEEVCYVTSSVNGEIKPWEMLQLMTYFQYYVISNSTFFWWGQFLSNSSARIVVAPSVWRSGNQEVYKEIYEDSWILLTPDTGEHIC